VNELNLFGDVRLMSAALPHGGAKAGVLKQAKSSVFHQRLGVGAFFGGDLGKLRFLLGGEMYFHQSQTETSGAKKQDVARKVQLN